jgi:hypothetical protein
MIRFMQKFIAYIQEVIPIVQFKMLIAMKMHKGGKV